MIRPLLCGSFSSGKDLFGSVGFADLKADENTPIPAIIYGQKPPARLSRAPVKVDEIDR